MSTGVVTSVEALFRLLESSVHLDDDAPGADRVDQLAHQLQTAALAAESAPRDDELIVAALVHDLGHIVDPEAADRHGELGRALVEPLLGARVGRLVELHVPAKRYLVATDPSYASILSSGSATTLHLQGGAMSAAEIDQFETEPFSEDAVRLRRADDGAKVPDRRVPGLDHWHATVVSVAR